MSLNVNVLFIGIGFYDYDNIIVQQFKEFGYHVDYFCEAPDGIKFRYYSRRGNHKKVQKIINELNLDIANKAASNYDYVFVIKGGNLTHQAIELIKKKNPNAKWILYLWDSVNRIPGITELFDHFHSIYSFDRIDCNENPRLKFNPLFYRKEYDQPHCDSNSAIDLYFLGWYHSDRLLLINKIITFCEENNLKYNIKLYCGLFSYLYQSIRGGELKNKKNLLIYRPISADRNIRNILDSKCTLDIAHPLQSGLTMRTIELLGAHKKIITTNKDIINYEFYNPNNVLILDRDNPLLSTEFFKMPYQPIDEKIVEQYSLPNWLSRMIN